MKKIKLSTLGSLVKANEKPQQHSMKLSHPAGWVRIAKGTRAAAIAASGFITILNDYQTYSSGYVMFSYLIGNENPHVYIHNKLHNVFTKIRIVKTAIDSFIEVYMVSLNGVYVVLSQNISSDLLPAPVEGNVPEGYTVFEFTV